VPTQIHKKYETQTYAANQGNQKAYAQGRNKGKAITTKPRQTRGQHDSTGTQLVLTMEMAITVTPMIHRPVAVTAAPRSLSRAVRDKERHYRMRGVPESEKSAEG